MALLKFDKKETRDTSLTVRLKSSSIKKLKEIAEKFEVSQATVIEKLINEAYSEVESKKRKGNK